MGRNSGGVSGSGAGKVKANKGATETGYTAKMVKNIVGIEQKYRNNKDETLHVFTPTGDIVTSFGGKGAKVVFDGSKVPQDAILTHNHPRSIGKTGIKSIGNSFSVHDIASAVRCNAKEMRAVTPTYTFSIKRPKGGWGGDYKSIVKEFNKVSNKVFKNNSDYVYKQGYSQSAADRAEVTYFHLVMKAMSKKYGWEYSKKKG